VAPCKLKPKKRSEIRLELNKKKQEINWTKVAPCKLKPCFKTKKWLLCNLKI